MPWRVLGRPALILFVVLAGILACTCTGCRWLPRVRPQATLDPRALSEANGTPPAPALITNLAGAPEQTLPALPQLQPVSVEVALASGGPESAAAPAAMPTKFTQRPETPAAAAPVATAELVLQPTPPSTTIQAETHADEPGRVDAVVVRATDADERGLGLSGAPADAESLWAAGIDRLLELARREAVAEAKAGRSGIWWEREQFLDRLMRSDGTRWRQIMAALAEGEKSPSDEPEVESPQRPVDARVAPESPSEAVEIAAEPAPPALAISTLALCRRVDGFGNYDPLPEGKLKPGQVLAIYWEVEGLQARPDGSWHQTRVRTTLQLCKKDSTEIAWQRSLGSAEDACRRPRRDFFANTRWRVPETLGPGDYVLRVRVVDEHADTECTADIPLAID